MSSIFISRKVAPSSSIRLFAEENQHQLHDISLIEFTSESFVCPTTKWIFFYSKQGVKHFFARVSSDQISDARIICFGDSTADYCCQYMDVFASANASIDQAMKIIEGVPKNEKITFVCGQLSLRSVHQKLPSSKVEECIVYRQSPKSVSLENDYDFALLTSPMNVENFFESNGRAQHYVAIGPTTKNALLNYENDVFQADRPCEEDMLMIVRRLLSN